MGLFGRAKDSQKQITEPANGAVVKVEKKENPKETEQLNAKKKTNTIAHKILVKPLVTEKGNALSSNNQYLFEVTKNTNKNEIKKAIYAVYNVHPVSVNVINVLGKKVRRGRSFGQMKNWKKAVVTLKSGDKIEFFEGI